MLAEELANVQQDSRREIEARGFGVNRSSRITVDRKVQEWP